MMTSCFLPALILAPALALSPQQAPQGKVRIFVSASAETAYQGVMQRASDLDQIARDVRKSLKKSRWLSVTEDAEEADVIVRILGRRTSPDESLALGYSLDAGDFKTEDEFVYSEEASLGSRGRTTSIDKPGGSEQTLRGARWSDAARRFGASLELFAQTNYELILARRKR
jgi:hypothetical protein